MDEMGWDVSVLSNLESDLELLENDFEGVTFRGFPMDIRNLREAGIESCDAVAVTTADDNLNITVAQIAARLLRYPKRGGACIRPRA